MSALFRHLARLFSTSSHPTGGAAGDVWWRSDVSQLHASDGGTSPIIAGPTGNLPVIRSGGWHALPAYGTLGSNSIPNQRIFALPLWTGRSTTITAVAVNVAVLSVGSAIRIGLYASDGAVPTTLVADYGTVTGGVLGHQQISGLSTPVRPVLYFLAVGRQGGATALTVSARDTWDPIIAETTPQLDVNRNTYFIDAVAGALPASFGAVAGSTRGPSATIQFT